MHPLNPFLRAFFRSNLPQQCNPVRDHVLLVPTTEILLSTRDKESGTPLADLVNSEEFLGSHVLRIPGGSAADAPQAKDSMRETRTKPKQYTTINGRTVVVKDTFVYSNKGFKLLNQAQLLNDVIWYPDTLSAQPWLVYFITRPLVGTLEPIHIPIAIVPKDRVPPVTGIDGTVSPSSPKSTTSSSSLSATKKEIKSFGELLSNYPMIARQMQPGLQKLFREFTMLFDKPLLGPSLKEPTAATGLAEDIIEANGADGASTNGSTNSTAISYTDPDEIEDEEDRLRTALETSVTAAIDLFQLVDKQQLSLLGSTTDLTGPKVERLIERYVAEQLNDSVLFPRICKLYQVQDQELQSNIRRMENVDVSQVGIAIEGGQKGKQLLIARLDRGVEYFKKLGAASSPQEMMDILLETAQIVTKPEIAPSDPSDLSNGTSEKHNMVTAVNADTLVSMLLIVVIRSQVRHLHARVSYMQRFIFIDDVEAGEMGYALSTIEALLQYLTHDSRALRRASKRNQKLWQAVQTGSLSDVKALLDPTALPSMPNALDGTGNPDDTVSESDSDAEPPSKTSKANGRYHSRSRSNSINHDSLSQASTLNHVFPFQAEEPSTGPRSEASRGTGKRVSIHSRTTSAVSIISQLSRTTTIDSQASAIEADTSLEKLTQTQNSDGQSILMMTVQKCQTEVLKYLLTLDQFYPFDQVLEDVDNDGTTLLSAAVQLGDSETVEILVDFVLTADDDETIKKYFGKTDKMGRSFAHYLFNCPSLISRFGRLLPWRLKDRNGQTPLFALARSYDHQTYNTMVGEALSAAKDAQQDGQPLHMDEHVDSKGNTVLHIVRDAELALRILEDCDTDVNAANDKRFTPLMVASKYGRVDMVRILFGDPRVDLFAKELRGLSAVELAKDDDVRNRIDDLTLFCTRPRQDDRYTAVVRSFFVEDATIRLVIKSGGPSSNYTITVTTSRRSFADFEKLAKCLALENPASWIPSFFGLRSPFQIPSKPSRAALRDIQVKLDNFLQILLSHSTFQTHEMLWEFFLVPDIQPEMLAERSRRKALAREERVIEDFPPTEDIAGVLTFVDHARDTVNRLNVAFRSLIRRVSRMRATANDCCVANVMCARSVGTLSDLPTGHGTALLHYSSALDPTESAPHNILLSDLQSIASTFQAVLTSLNRPNNLILQMDRASKDIDKHMSSMRRSDRWPLGLLDDTRAKYHQEAAAKAQAAREELVVLGSELTYTQQTVASELAAWQELHSSLTKKALREFARRTVIAEKARLECMKRAVRKVITLKDPPVLPQKGSILQFYSPTGKKEGSK
jgi:hypothetical protein